MENQFNSTDQQDLALERARYRVRKISRFYTHLFIYIVGVLLYFAKTYFGAPFNFWPIVYINCFFMTIWTIVIGIQGIKLFFRERVFGTDWEQRKMQEFLNKDKHNKWE